MIDQLIGQTLAGKYRIEERWREDATSKTYRATHVLMDKLVLLKVLNPALAANGEAVREFQNEARLLSRLNSPNVLTIQDFGADENNLPFLVLEDFDGRSLQSLVRDELDLPLARAAAIVRQIADALTAANAVNLNHGNLNAENILIQTRANGDAVKVLDFARVDVDDERTVLRSFLPHYKSPEQLTGATPAGDERSDIYALGVILFELLTGRLPFTGDNAGLIAQKHLQEIPPSLIAARPDLPLQTEQIVQRALAKNPAQRFASAAEFAESLNRVAANGHAEAGDAAFAGNVNAAPPARAVPESNGSDRWKTAFIVLLGIGLLSFLAIFLTGRTGTTPNTQMSSDPNAQPAQPINPTTGTGEDLTNLNLQPLENSNSLDPSNQYPYAGGGPSGGIPPGLYNGQVVTVNGNNSFVTDGNVNLQTNGNANIKTGTNVNAKPGNTANANAAPSPKGNANTAPSPKSNTNAAPAPSITPSPRPSATVKPVESPNKTATNKPLEP